jgi:hypothetical protein
MTGLMTFGKDLATICYDKCAKSAKKVARSAEKVRYTIPKFGVQNVAAPVPWYKFRGGGTNYFERMDPKEVVVHINKKNYQSKVSEIHKDQVPRFFLSMNGVKLGRHPPDFDSIPCTCDHKLEASRAVDIIS